jgi:hypothetical protein
VTCPDALIIHADGTIAGCTEDDEPDGCRGRVQRHEKVIPFRASCGCRRHF